MPWGNEWLRVKAWTWSTGRVYARRFDGAGRLNLAERGTPPTDQRAWDYDTASQRLQARSGAQADSYGYDAAGHLTTQMNQTHLYDGAGRRVSTIVTGSGSSGAGLVGTSTYVYNGLGQRVKKVTPAGTVLYAYDEAGHLVGEYTAAGAVLQETVWLG